MIYLHKRSFKRFLPALAALCLVLVFSPVFLGNTSVAHAAGQSVPEQHFVSDNALSYRYMDRPALLAYGSAAMASPGSLAPLGGALSATDTSSPDADSNSESDSPPAHLAKKFLGKKVIDQSGKFTSAEQQQFAERIATISAKYNQDIYILFVNDISGMEPGEFNQQFYRSGGYGLGTDKSGIGLLVSVNTRDIHMTRNGSATEVFTLYGLEKIYLDVKAKLKDDQWQAGVNIFLDDCHDFMAQAKRGKPYDSSNPRTDSSTIWIGGLIGLAVGSALSAMIVFYLRSKHLTARKQELASVYVRPGSFQLSGSSDEFLYRHQTQTPIVRSDNNSSGSGFSSSGGGGGGKF